MQSGNRSWCPPIEMRACHCDSIMRLLLFCPFSEVYGKNNYYRMNERGEPSASLHWRAREENSQSHLSAAKPVGLVPAKVSFSAATPVHPKCARFRVAKFLGGISPSLKSQGIKTDPEPKSVSHTQPTPRGGLGEAEACSLTITFTALRKPRRKN